MSANLLYEMYEYRLARSLPRHKLPRHIGVILDGNRRWARMGGSSEREGHRVGASKVGEFLQWASEMEVEIATLWMLSTDNMDRDPQEVADLLTIIAQTVEELAQQQRYRINMVGDKTLFPQWFTNRIEAAVEETKQLSEAMAVNVAVGYGGRRELVDAVRSLLLSKEAQGGTLGELAETLSDTDITDHLYTAGQPDPDLIIRTSGEQRLSGFMLWQSAHSEYYFSDVYWPDFRRVDFLRALRSYVQRERRLGR